MAYLQSGSSKTPLTLFTEKKIIMPNEKWLFTDHSALSLFKTLYPDFYGAYLAPCKAILDQWSSNTQKDEFANIIALCENQLHIEFSTKSQAIFQILLNVLKKQAEEKNVIFVAPGSCRYLGDYNRDSKEYYTITLAVELTKLGCFQKLITDTVFPAISKIPKAKTATVLPPEDFAFGESGQNLVALMATLYPDFNQNYFFPYTLTTSYVLEQTNYYVEARIVALRESMLHIEFLIASNKRYQKSQQEVFQKIFDELLRVLKNQPEGSCVKYLALGAGSSGIPCVQEQFPKTIVVVADPLRPNDFQKFLEEKLPLKITPLCKPPQLKAQTSASSSNTTYRH